MTTKHVTGSPNHGKTQVSSLRGQKIRTDYGKDSSDVHGSAKHERMGSCGGGSTDLGHSLSGSSAKQRAD